MGSLFPPGRQRPTAPPRRWRAPELSGVGQVVTGHIGQQVRRHRELEATESVEFKFLGSSDQLCDAAFDVVEGVSERCELLHGVLLPLVRGGPVPHRPLDRGRRFGCALVDRQDGDELVDVQGLVVGQAGVTPGGPGVRWSAGSVPRSAGVGVPIG